MSPSLPTDLDGYGEEEGTLGRGSVVPPERSRKQKISRRAKMQARRSRSNEMAKRGMHQRRAKRTAW